MYNYLNSLENQRKKTAIISFIIYALFSLAFILRFSGYFAHDELYHLSASNADFFVVSRYNRAPYLNLTIHFLSSFFGQNYFIYKLIPYVLGLVSFSIFLYLIYHLAEHTYSIICFAFLMCTHSFLIVNHMYIRMYVCDEAAIAILALILYKLAHTASILIRILLHILYFVSAGFLYCFQHHEQSAIAVLGIGILAWILNYIGSIIIPFLKRKNYIRTALILCSILVLSMTMYIIAIRCNIFPCPQILSKAMVYHYTIEIVEPVFTGYFLTKGIFLTIGLIGFGYLLLTRELKNNMLGIYLLGFLPFLAYNMLYFDQRLFRSFTSYMPILILVTILWLDYFSISKKSVGRIVVITILTALFSYPRATMHIKEFYTTPYIVGEVYFDNYGSLISQVSADIASGRKCFCIWANKHAEAVCNQLNWETDFCLEDDLNHIYEYTEEDFLNLLDYFETLQESYVLVVGADCSRKINSYWTRQFIDTLCATYPYDEYLQDAYLFYIN